MRLTPALLVAFVLLARAVAAASVLEREQAVGGASAERAKLVAAQHRLQAEAAALAERISQLKVPGAAPRAGRELTRQLREFDRLAGRLDALEGDVVEQERRIARARAEFQAAADEEEQRLEQRARREGAGAVAEALSALESARRRVAALESAIAFRPPLEVALDPQDGPAEIEAKLAVLAGERARVSARLQDLRRDEGLLATRIEAKREWARELGVARRDAGGSVELLDRGYEQVQAALRALSARAEALVRERAALESAEAGLAARQREAEERWRALRKGNESR
jgi:chromosome segregation ATPase